MHYSGEISTTDGDSMTVTIGPKSNLLSLSHIRKLNLQQTTLKTSWQKCEKPPYIRVYFLNRVENIEAVRKICLF